MCMYKYVYVCMYIFWYECRLVWQSGVNRQLNGVVVRYREELGRKVLTVELCVV